MAPPQAKSGNMDATQPGPKRLGRYDLLQPLASGLAAKTYKAFDRISGRTVALKVIPADVLKRYDARTIARFQSDVHAASSLKHPGIVSVYGYGEESGFAYVATEDAEGWSLRERLQLPAKEAVALVVQLLEILDYAHNRGIIHGDIRPSNLVLTAGGLRISGFGMSALGAPTRNYMAPEQFLGLPVDSRSDIFAAGVVFYELLTGVNPFAGDPETLADRVCRQPEPRPSVMNSKVVSAFDNVCVKSLAKDPQQRYVTARAFSEATRDAFQVAHGSRPSNVISNETVVEATLGDKDSIAEPATAPEPQVTAVSVIPAPRWDADILRAIEKQLAVFVGPLAKIIVTKAAKKTGDLDRLYAIIGANLDHGDRQAFLQLRQELPPTRNESRIQKPVELRTSAAASASPGKREVRVEPAVAPQPLPQPETSSAATPAQKPEPSVTGLEADTLPAAQPALIPKRAGEAPRSPTPAAKEGRSLRILGRKNSGVARLEDMLGKQPEDLAGYLKDRPPQVEEVVHAFVAAVEALIAAHAANPKIEPLTPHSIGFDAMGKATIRKQVGGTHGSGGLGSNPRYAAPELFAEKAFDPERAGASPHIYALGLIFYELILGRDLFAKTFAAQRTDLDWMRWHAALDVKAPPAKSLVPGCPAELSDLLESMMEKHADKRAGDLQEILSILRSVAQRANKTILLQMPSAKPQPETAAEAHVAPAENNRSVLLLVVVIIALAVAAAVIGFWQNPEAWRELISRLHQFFP